MTSPATPGCRNRFLGMTALLLPAWIIAIIPSALPRLIYDRNAILHGECWRMVTGHWVHFSKLHLTTDSIAWILVILCMPAGSGRRMTRALAVSSIVIPLTLWFADPDLIRYAGLSGLGMTAWAFVAVDRWRRVSEGDWSGPLIASVLLLKWVMEATGGFAGAAPLPDIEPATLAHGVGAVCGTVLCIQPSQGTLTAVLACDEKHSTP